MDARVDAAQIDAAASTKEITAFAFPSAINPALGTNVAALIRGTTITAIVPYTTSSSVLTPTFVTSGTSVTVAGLVQTSGVSSQLFTSPVVYTVHAANGSTLDYRVTVTTQAKLATGNGPQSATAGDLDGDGRPDLVAANFSGRDVSVFLNTTSGHGTYPTFSSSMFTTSLEPNSIAIGDMDASGTPDIVFPEPGGNVMGILVNSSTGFSAPKEFAVGTMPRELALADFNGDDKLDAAVTNQSDGSFSVLFNTTISAGSPSFASHQDVTLAGTPYSIASGDLNMDGKPDLAVASDAGSGTISIMLDTTATNAATLALTAATNLQLAASVVRIADVDGDGKPDLIAARWNVSVLINTTAQGSLTPTFAAPVVLPGSDAVAIDIGDIDGDGRPDIAAANPSYNTVSVWLNTTTHPGSPTFSARTDLPTGAVPTAVIVRDLDADGHADLTVANYNENTFSIFIAP